MEKRWKSTIFNGTNVFFFLSENDGKSSFLLEKQWKHIIFNGKTMENNNF
jgi:hypothetical protein